MSSTTRATTGSVRFADMAQMYIVERRTNNVARHELWYTASDVRSMRRVIERDVLQVRAQASAGAPFDYAGNDESSVCCIGIEHLLTADIEHEMEACRARCIQAVLAEQARQGPSARFGWETIALASFAQTKKVALRARKLGQLQQDSI